ncbi:MAG: hypothetical protein KC910_14315, partial [Candidatus Eremiobacteraeota bacterium]|nr:hypothetical protein [Candidatus Eremiobacteraeota bacterium]
FDFSQPRVQPIQITQTWVTTHQALVKTYEVEYLDPDTGASTRASVSPLALLDATGGEALTYRGALGVRWRRIRLTNEPEPESQTVNQR